MVGENCQISSKTAFSRLSDKKVINSGILNLFLGVNKLGYNVLPATLKKCILWIMFKVNLKNSVKKDPSLPPFPKMGGLLGGNATRNNNRGDLCRQS
jgi:hypothetical protein